MKITYIEHSGFFLETGEVDFLFDYYQGNIPQRDKEKPLMVLVSHSHHDHYNPTIFGLVKKYPNTRYILSKDIPIKIGIDLERYITLAEKNDVQMIAMPNGKNLKVETFQSTDEGVAFLLEFDGKTIYHAGDLNLWIWEGESEKYNEDMTKTYFKELEKLKDRQVDIAFVPLDPRQGKDAFGGMESFLSYTKSQIVFPMHFWGEYGIIEKFLKKHPECEELVKRVEYAGQSFEIEERME